MLFMKGDPETPRCGFSKQTIGILSEIGYDNRKDQKNNLMILLWFSFYKTVSIWMPTGINWSWSLINTACILSKQ